MFGSEPEVRNITESRLDESTLNSIGSEFDCICGIQGLEASLLGYDRLELGCISAFVLLGLFSHATICE